MSCDPQTHNDTHFLVNALTSDRNYNASDSRTYSVAYIVVFQSPKYSIINGALNGVSGGISFHSYSTIGPLTHYIIGLGDYYKPGRLIYAALINDDKQIDGSYSSSYLGLNYPYFIITQVGDTSGIHIFRVTLYSMQRILNMQY